MKRTLEEAILHTVHYCDLVDVAPTLLEIERWLLKTEQRPSISDIQQTIAQNPELLQKDGVLFLHGREELVHARTTTYNATERKWKRARWFIRLLACLPGVEAIFFVNSVAWGNAKPGSDIDLAIIASPGRIWTARLWSSGIMKLLRQRPGEQSHDKALCLSLYIARDTLNIAQYTMQDEDIHYTFWASQVYPIYDPQNIYAEYQEANSWIAENFTALRWLKSIPQRRVTIGRIARAAKTFLTFCTPEQLAKRIQLRILPEKLRAIANTDNRVVINDTILKLHDNDHRIEFQEQWERRIA